MAIKTNIQTSTGGQFTADKDYHGTTEDGRSYLKVAEGVTIPMSEAIETGIVKGAKTDKAAEPEIDAPEAGEKAAEAPAANKSQSPAANKGGK